MSQPPPNRFGFQKPQIVTVTSSRTKRVPGTNTTTTEASTTLTQVNQSSMQSAAQPQVSRYAVPRGRPQTAPQASLPPPQASSTMRAPTSSTQLASSRIPTQRGFQASQMPRGLMSSSQLARSRIPSQQAVQDSQGLRGLTASTSVRSGIPQTSKLSLLTSSRLQQPNLVSRLPSQIKPPAGRAIPTGIPRTSSLIPGSQPPPPHLEVSEILPTITQPGRAIPTAQTSKYGKRQQQVIDHNISRIQSLQLVPQGQQTAEQKVHGTLLNQSIRKPGEKVIAKGKFVSKLRPISFKTPAGVETVMQKAVLAKKVERDGEGERVVKNFAIADFNEQTGQMENVEIDVQELNPDFKLSKGKDVIGVTSTVIVTPAYTTLSKDILRTGTQPLNDGWMIDPVHISQLVEDEKEDVESTLRMIQPDMVLSPGNYMTKQRLQQLRINSESIALLEQSIIQPPPCADEAQTDLVPEAMATVMYSVEKGATPEADPGRLFHSLFSDPSAEQIVELSSVSPGPLRT
ncbi:hypothetical protein JTB14_012696 [Gonioctena quinquepunctata]|nr:hypothetical protein JTB14_012696 [Gonioctena quinquepunctata]